MSEYYAHGSKAWGMCQRCGLRSYLNDLVPDGRYPDILVHPNDCYEPPVIEEQSIPKIFDAVNLKKPSPDNDKNDISISFPNYQADSDQNNDLLTISVDVTSVVVRMPTDIGSEEGQLFITEDGLNYFVLENNTTEFTSYQFTTEDGASVFVLENGTKYLEAQ